MGTARAVIARASIALAVAAPWLAFTAVANNALAEAITAAVLFVAAARGFGRGVVRIVHRDPGEPVALAWGVATIVVLAGITMLLGLRAQLAVLVLGAALHSLDLVRAFPTRSESLASALVWSRARWWLLPAVLATTIVFLQVAGTVGSVIESPFDDDGNVLAQLRRLLDTGQLGDAVGYARLAHPGGFASLAAVLAAPADLHVGLALDSIGLGMLLAMVCWRIGARDAAQTVWATIAVLAVSAAAIAWHGPVPLWLGIALLVALYETMLGGDEAHYRTIVPPALLLAALAALRYDFMAPGVVLVIAAGHRHRGRVAATLGLAVALVLPYVVARELAWHTVDHTAVALLSPSTAPLWLRTLEFVGIALASTPLLLLPAAWLEHRQARWMAIAVAVGLAVVGSHLVDPKPFGSRFAWPIALAGCTVLALESARHLAAKLGTLVLALATILLAVISAGELRHGRKAWSWRYNDLVANIEYLAHGRAASHDLAYERLVALVPSDATLAVSLLRPEELGYAGHRIVDLRTPRALPLQGVAGVHHARLQQLLAASGAQYLLYEDDGRRTRRAEQSLAFRLACMPPTTASVQDICTDDFEQVVRQASVVASAPGLWLVKL